jgi:hypothetical protein
MAQPGKQSNAISELVEHFRLDAQCHDDHTLVSLPVRGRRSEKRQEKWTRMKALGQGSFGIVWLEQKVGEDTKDVRAVKEIRKGMGHRLAFNIDYARELYAMARLTRVSTPTMTSGSSNFWWISTPTILPSSMAGMKTMAPSSFRWNTFRTATWQTVFAGQFWSRRRKRSSVNCLRVFRSFTNMR